MVKKQKIIIIFILTIFFLSLAAAFENNKDKFVLNDLGTNLSSNENFNNDLILTILNPFISKAIEDNYGKPLMYDLWASSIQETGRKGKAFNFQITVQVNPYVGNHDLVGTDLITLNIMPEAIKIIKFKHLKSYPLPAHLYNYYKDLRF